MTFNTPNELLKSGKCPVNETTLRRMIHAGKVPGFQNGRTYLVNVEAFMEMLDAQSRANVRADAQ